jgi:hypothetical protein
MRRCFLRTRTRLDMNMLRIRRPGRDLMFIERRLQRFSPLPKERYLIDVAYSSPETLRSCGVRVGEFKAPVYKHPAPPELVGYLVSVVNRGEDHCEIQKRHSFRS